MRLLLALLTLATAVAPAAQTDPAADTSTAALRIEAARLDLARRDLGALSLWQRARPSVSVFVSVATRGRLFPAVSAQGYDPAYSQLVAWPGDTWGLTASWSLDRLIDRAPLRRARAAVAQAEARVDLVHARRAATEARHRQALARHAEQHALRDARRAEALRRAERAAAELDIEAGFLARRLDAQRELLSLAQIRYDQGDLAYEALARQRLAVLAAEHAGATNAARLESARREADGLGLAPDAVATADAP